MDRDAAKLAGARVDGWLTSGLRRNIAFASVPDA